MRLRAMAIAVVLLGATATSSVGKPAPESAKRWSFEIAPAARQMVGELDPQALLDDAFFLRQLARILGSPIAPEAKVDAFVLLLDKIGWLFAGSVPVPAGRSYTEVFGGIAGTFFQYQEQLDQQTWDVAPFLIIADSQCGGHAVRCSNALLLAVLLDRDTARTAIDRAATPENLRSAQVEAVFLHGLALSTVLTRDAQTVLRLGGLLYETKLEEGREDIIAALAIYPSSESTAILRAFVRRDLPQRLDNATDNALDIVNQRSPAVEVEAWLLGLSQDLPTETRARLRERHAQGFAHRPEAGMGLFRKTWDGFDVTIYDDGIRFEHPPGFSYFQGN
jgi:hypothetical protein